MPKPDSLASLLVEIPGFFDTRPSTVDGVSVPIAPFYIEYAYLVPPMLEKLRAIVSDAIWNFSPTAIVTPEAAMLPLTSLIACDFRIPLITVRKPRHHAHEAGEPMLFVGKLTAEDRARVVFVDDAIWSCETLSHSLELLETASVYPAGLYVLIDLSELPGAMKFLRQKDEAIFRRRVCGTTYREILRAARENGVLSEEKEQSILDWLHRMKKSPASA